ncbi:MAG: hypothetical protein ACYS8X_15160, partial [Planctomycetota bacterium]
MTTHSHTSCRRQGWLAPAMAFGLVLAVSVVDADGPAEGAKKPPRVQLKVGDEAPDFDLPRLVVTKDEDGNETVSVSEETVKLSSFRG